MPYSFRVNVNVALLFFLNLEERIIYDVYLFSMIFWIFMTFPEHNINNSSNRSSFPDSDANLSHF